MFHLSRHVSLVLRYRTASPVSVISKGDKALAAVNHSWLFDAEGDSLKVQYKLPHGLAMFLDLYALTRCNKVNGSYGCA